LKPKLAPTRRFKQSVFASLVLILALTISSVSSVFAATQIISGSASNGNLRITVQDSGRMNVERYVSGAFQTQVYAGSDKSSVLRINGTNYTSGYFNGTAVTSVSNTTVGLLITTVWTAGGAQITQRTSYIDGDAFYRLQWDIQNTGASSLSDLRFFHGEDTYLQGGDAAGGLWDAPNNTVGAQKVVGGVQQRMLLAAQTLPYAYESQNYYSMYQSINAGALTNAIDANVGTDNGYALEWRNAALATSTTWTIVAYEKFTSSIVGALTVTAPIAVNCSAGTGCDLVYTVANPSASAASATFTPSSDQATWNPTITSPGSSASIPANSSVSVIVHIAVPGGTVNGTLGHFTLTANDGTTNSSDVTTVTVATSASYNLTVSSSGTGAGTISSTPAGITCGADCTESYVSGTSVSLAATPNAGSAFAGWSGACSGIGTCDVTMDTTRNVIATFTTAPASFDLTVSHNGTGSGSIASIPAGITCGVDCSETYATGTSVSLTPTPAAGSTFAGWSGACSGTGTCDVTMDAAKSVVATFNDTSAPTAPTVTNPAGGSATNDTTPAFSGTAEPGSTVNVQVDGVTYCSATADSLGAWSCTSATILNPGSRAVSVTATDAAANTSPATTLSFMIDTNAPAAPVVTSPVDGSVTNNQTPTFSGTAEAGSTVTVMDGTTVICSAVATGGNWTCTAGAAMAEGNHSLAVSATDAAGNTSTDATLALEIDLTAPATPTIGTANVTGDVTPTFFGTAEPGSQVAVTVDGVASCTATTNGTGNWSCVAGTALSPGAHAVSAIATDPAGNPSTPATLALTIDTTQPDSPTISSPAITSDTTPVFTGTAEPNGTVKVNVDGVLYCTTTANGAGNWTCTAATLLTVGSHAVSAVVTDAANNTSPAATQALTIDTGAPSAPAITSPALVNDTTPTIAGTAEPGSTVTVKVDGVTVCTDVVSASGAWSCRPTTPLTNGDHAVTATATDAANNVSPAASQTLTIDTTAPTAPVVTSPANGASVGGTPTFAGTAAPGATVTVRDGEIVLCTATVDSAGNWSCTAATQLTEGTHDITVVATDPAGNTSTTAEVAVSVDSTAPIQSAITSPRSTIQHFPRIFGTAEAGSTVTVVLDPDNNPATDNSVTFVTTADAAGTWTIDTFKATPTNGAMPADGIPEKSEVSIQAVARDAAGNTSSVARQLLYIGGRTYFPAFVLGAAGK